MDSFLYQIASLFLNEYKAKISTLAFVFPNRRAGLFFQKYLSEIYGKPLFSPTILTISDLFMRLSDKQTADRISMLFTLYDIYIRRSGSLETFDEFLYWGEMLLNDFDDIDKYMVNARMLFTNVKDLRAIETDFSFLSPAQIAAIRSFWSSFYPVSDSPNQQSFLAVWEIIYELYTDLRESLAGKGKGYEGMIFREVVENMREGKYKELPFSGIVFVGLNALSVVEEKLLLELQALGIADFYWDYESDLVNDPENKASFFVKRNRALFPSAMKLPENLEKEEADIEVIGIPSAIGQAKQVHAILSSYADEKGISDEDALRTAVILPDEHLLIPVINAIPEQINRINVTMGYPLTSTPVASLMEYILTLQRNLRYVDRYPVFYFRDVLPILNHRYIAATSPDTVACLVKDITLSNKIFIRSTDLDKTSILSTLFTPVEDAASFSDYLVRILEKLNELIEKDKSEEASEREDADFQESDFQFSNTRDIEQEFIFHYFTTVNRMQEVMRETQVEMKIDTYFRLLKRMTDMISIPFRGEPLSGLQIMGVLETRALDFDRVIILSMNEGIFPQKKTANSFIPYNLRRGFGLPTYEHQDSLWAYHFYRLIYRAKHVHLLYDTRNTGIQSGEKSRFIHQLHYHYEKPIQNKLVVYNVSSSKTSPIRITKSEEVIERLSVFRKNGTRAISASAINTYLDCPLKFYFSNVEGVQEEDEIKETIESSVFGSILHKVMEDIYAPLCGKMVTADVLALIRKDKVGISRFIEKAFAEVFFKTGVPRPLTGQNFLIGEMIRKYAEKIIARDSKLTPFRYVESEKRMNDVISLSDGSEIQLKGFIDRIDEVNDTIRIIDYKSGHGLQHFTTIENLFDVEEKERAKAIMQVFMYSWMYSRQSGINGKAVQPGIYYMRTIFSEEFDACINHRPKRNEKVRVERFEEYAEEYEMYMRLCLEKIFDTEHPFVQTKILKVCVYCSFKGICGR